MQLSAKNVASNKIVWSAVVFFWGIGHDAASAQELTQLHETVVSSVGFSRSQTFNASAQNGDMSLTARADGLLQNSLYVDRNLQQTRRPSSVPAKIGGGFLGGVVGGSVGALAGVFTEIHILGSPNEQAGIAGAFLGTTVGILLGLPIGLSVASRMESPQREYFGAASLGAMVGFIPGTLLAINFFTYDRFETGIAVGLGLPIAGAIIGRALYASKKRKGEEQNLFGDLPVNVMAGPGSDGGFSFGFRTTF